MDPVDAYTMTELTKETEEFPGMLKALGLTFEYSYPYLQVGEIMAFPGWILHLSVIRTEIKEVLEIVLPLLVKPQIPFKIPIDLGTAGNLLDGCFGQWLIGKLITIYPKTLQQASELANRLVTLSSVFRGPEIPDCIHLGGRVYASTADGTRSHDTDSRKLYKIACSQGHPFGTLHKPLLFKSRRILGGKFALHSMIKSDPKGSVFKGILFKPLYKMSFCIIKQGKSEMLCDENNRSMKDRLLWQENLLRDLRVIIPVPAVLDCFSENGDTFLATEYIDGLPLQNIIQSTFSNGSWASLPISDRQRLLNYFLQILDSVEKLHQLGFVHRDISPSNFIINKQNCVVFIDLELMYSINKQYPDPPFATGTPGFLAPEQVDLKEPSETEDIYSLGALLLLFCTGMAPVQFELTNSEMFEESLEFFLDDLQMTTPILSCLDKQPSNRPDLKYLKNCTKDHFERLSSATFTGNRSSRGNFIQHEDLEGLIQGGLNGLGNQKMNNVDWKQEIPQNETNKDLSGVLYTLSVAKRSGLDIEKTAKSWLSVLTYIPTRQTNGYSNRLDSSSDLNFQLAVAIASGIESGLIKSRPEIRSLVQHCFDTELSRIDTKEGIALLQCEGQLDPEYFDQALKNLLDSIQRRQNRDGSWSEGRTGRWQNSLEKYRSNMDATANAIFFLSKCLSRFTFPGIEKSMIRGFEWLANRYSKKITCSTWPDPLERKVILVLIRGFEVSADHHFRNIVEKALRTIPFEVVNIDLSQESGLAGLGEIYLEAYRVFKSDEWNERGKWIVALLFHSRRIFPDGLFFWNTCNIDFPKPNFNTGASGLLHFLMRYAYTGKIPYPIIFSI
jgi:serine/threonine protein kinase